MYQVFDAPDIFGPPPAPPSNDDFTLQRRYRGPDEGGGGSGGCGEIGGGIDDVLGWLGLPSPGGGIRAGYDDPGGGGGCGGGGGLFSWGAAGFRTLDEQGLGQLMMETDNDDADYFDYSCLSSGLMSPDVESEFFVGAPACIGGHHQLPLVRFPDAYSWPAFDPSACTSLPDRPPSPLFGDFRNATATGSDVSYQDVMTSRRDLLFDSEAQAKVKEIARYLASFEVQPWSVAASQRSLASSCSTPASQPTSPFEEIGSISGSNRPNRTTVNSRQKAIGADCGTPSSSVSFFHAGFDDSCGLETTMVNPNDVFPDRTDHQYASSRPSRDQAPRGRQPSRSSQRTSPHMLTPRPKGKASSVLEALLRSTEPIDPNKGSGAAVALEDDQSEGEEVQRVVGRKTPERMLKKLLTGRVSRDDDPTRKGHRGHAEEASRASAKRSIETEVGCRASGGTSGRVFPGSIDVKVEKNISDESELARELGEIMREQTARENTMDFSFTSQFKSSAECFRCN